MATIVTEMTTETSDPYGDFPWPDDWSRESWFLAEATCTDCNGAMLNKAEDGPCRTCSGDGWVFVERVHGCEAGWLPVWDGGAVQCADCDDDARWY